MKASADSSLNISQIIKFELDWVENILEKLENAGYQYFLIFP